MTDELGHMWFSFLRFFIIKRSSRKDHLAATQISLNHIYCYSLWPGSYVYYLVSLVINLINLVSVAYTSIAKYKSYKMVLKYSNKVFKCFPHLDKGHIKGARRVLGDSLQSCRWCKCMQMRYSSICIWERTMVRREAKGQTSAGQRFVTIKVWKHLWN